MKTNLRIKSDLARAKRCKNLICVLENPKTIENVTSTIRNVDALGVEKLYVVDGYNLFNGKTWQQMRENHKLNKLSVSAIKWAFVKVYKTTQECLDYLKLKNFVSVVTSPHLKGHYNVILENGVYTNKRLAVWFGNESQGVSDLAISNSIACINIPVCGIIESLNLGTSTGIVLYEVAKQRRKFLENKL